MKLIIPKRLKKGAHLRVVAPSKSGSVLSDNTIKYATKRLESQGFRISFGKHWQDNNTALGIASIEDRLRDLHDAFRDPHVNGILTAIGGYNSNQLLSGIDYSLIRENPKVFCGFSDATVLCNALFVRSGIMTYLGPHFSSWAMDQGFDYSCDYFLKAIQESDPYNVMPSPNWSNDDWFMDQQTRNFYDNDAHEIVIHRGNAEGTIVGGNINSICALLGTRYMPSLKNSILLLEQGDETDLRSFDARLETITQQDDFSGVRGIIIGRFRQSTIATPNKLKEIISTKKVLKNIPVIANVNLGHTTPIATFAIGGKCDISINTSVVIRMISH